MNAHIPEGRDYYGFAIALVTGACVGAGLVLWFAPRAAAELRLRATESAGRLGEGVAAQYQRAGVRAGEAVDAVTAKVQNIRDGMADAVAHSAHEVERSALAARSTHGSGASTRSL